jgi:hypothetical protein
MAAVTEQPRRAAANDMMQQPLLPNTGTTAYELDHDYGPCDTALTVTFTNPAIGATPMRAKTVNGGCCAVSTFS